MTTTRTRATRATLGGGFVTLALLLGFYLLVLLLIAAMWGANLLLLWSTGTIVGWFVIGAFVGSATLIRAVVRLDQPAEDDGIPLDPERQPELWSVVRDAAAAAGTKPPAKVLLTCDLNAGVHERSRLLGLLGGRRTLVIGLPLIDAVSVDELRAVLAHEFGHFAAGHGRLGPLRYRTHASIVRATLLSRHWVRTVLGWYFRFFLRVTMRFNRARELDADRLAAEHVGAAPLARALITIEVAGEVYRTFCREVLSPVLKEGEQFPGAFDAWPHFLGARLGTGAARDVLTSTSGAAPDPHDSHPPLAERLGVLGFAHQPVPPRPIGAPGAASLVRDLEALRPAMGTLVTRMARLDPHTAPVVGAPELARRMVERHDRSCAEQLAKATAIVVGEARPAPLGRTLQVLYECGPDRLAAAAGKTDPVTGRAFVEEALTGSLRGLLTSSVPGYAAWLDPDSFSVLVNAPRGILDPGAAARHLLAAPGAIADVSPELGDGGLLWQWPTALGATPEAPERIKGVLATGRLATRPVLLLTTERSIVVLPLRATGRSLAGRQGQAIVEQELHEVAGRLLRDVVATHDGVVAFPLATSELTLGVPSQLHDPAGRWRLTLLGSDGVHVIDGLRAAGGVTGQIMRARVMALRPPHLTVTSLRGRVRALQN